MGAGGEEDEPDSTLADVLCGKLGSQVIVYLLFIGRDRDILFPFLLLPGSQVHNREKVHDAARLAQLYADRGDELERACRAKYGVSPFEKRKRRQVGMAPDGLPSQLREEEKGIINELIDQYALHRTTVRNSKGQAVEVDGGQQGDDQGISEAFTRIVRMNPKAENLPDQGGRPMTASPSRTDTLDSEPSVETTTGEEEEQEEATAPVAPKAPSAPPQLKSQLGSEWEGLDDIPEWWEEDYPFYDHYTLHWESDILKALGSSVSELVANLGQSAMVELLAYTTAVSSVRWKS